MIELAGKKMKPCPGWDGNSHRCGRGNPRLIRQDAEVCESCARGMRKRGQTTREEAAEDARIRADRIRDAESVASFVEQEAGVKVPVPGLQSILEARDAIVPHGSTLDDALYLLAGMEVPE